MKLLSLTTVVATLLTGVLARSSVYIVSNSQNELARNPEISMDAFSMFYSHMMDSSSHHPVLKLQNNDAIEDMITLLPPSNNLFEKKLDANLVVIVAGVQDAEAVLSTYSPSFYVNNDNPNNYAAVVTEAIDSNDVTSTTYKNQKKQTRKGELLQEIPSDVSVENFKHDFAKFNTDLFDTDREVDRKFMIEMETTKELVQTDVSATIIQLDTLQEIGEEYGFDSFKHREAQLIMKDLFENFVLPNFQNLHSRGVSTFILTPYTKQSYNKRGVSDFIAEGETCFTSAKACKNGTSSCNGNGQCVLVDEKCYACQCKSTSYVGDSCQYVNAVSDFQLLFWTSVLLIVTTVSVVVCVYQSGSNAEAGIILTQSAPKQE